MTIQHNSPRRFNFNSNSGLVLAPNAAEELILPEGIVIEPKQLNDKPALIIPQNRKPPENGYSQVNGIFIPTGTETTGAIQIVQAGSSDMRYGTQEKKRFSFEEVLYNSLEKIIKSEADNPWIKDIQEYFSRLEDLTQSYKKDRGILMHNKPSLAPLVMNREAFTKETNPEVTETTETETYYPLKEFSLNSNSLKQLENIVLQSLKVEDDSKSSSAKRFALRFLTNTVFIENFKSEKINQAVIQALKTDIEPAAKKIYEHYLTTRLGDLSIEQKREIIKILDTNNRLSSHLAQSLFLSEPSLKEGIETEEFPEVRDFEDLEKILTNLHTYSQAAMNQVDLRPSQINPDANYGIEIELKLAGANGYRDNTSIIQSRLKPYADFIELGVDFEGAISELRTLSGGFKLNEENQRKLFEVVNTFHQSPDLMLFLSQHVHVDRESTPTHDLLLGFIKNWDFPTLETKSLDLDTMQLTANNNLIYSYQVSNLIDQMIVLEELKYTKPSIEAILKSFELNKKYGISLSIAQVMLTAVENQKGYLIPNILRLNSQGKNYLETNYFAKNEGVDLMNQMIEINRKDVVKFMVDKIPDDKLGEVLTQVDDSGMNTLMHALDKGNKELAKLILSKIPEDKLGKVLTQVNNSGMNALMMALYYNKELAKLILSKIPDDKLGEVLTQVNNSGMNALMITLDWDDKESAKLILSKIPEDKLGEVLTQVNNSGMNALMTVLYKDNKELAKLILDKIPENKLGEVLTQVDRWGMNTLMHALDKDKKELAKLILSKIPDDKLGEVLTQLDDDKGMNALMMALYYNKELAKLILSKIPEDKLGEVLTQVNNSGTNALMIALDWNNKELAELILSKIPDDKLGEVLTQVDRWGMNTLMQALDKDKKELAKLILSKIPDDKLGEVLTQVDRWGMNTLMHALDKDKEELAKLILDKIPEDKLGEVLTQLDDEGRNALMMALDWNNKELAELILDKIPEDKLGEVLTQVDDDKVMNALMMAKYKKNKELVELILEKYEEIN